MRKRFASLVLAAVLHCLISAVPMYSQTFPRYLEENDINVFINGFDRVLDVFDEFADKNSDLQSYYKIIDLMLRITANAKSYGVRCQEDRLREWINLAVPEEMSDIFKAVGWEENGHKKFWTIYVYFSYLRMAKEQLDPDGGFIKMFWDIEEEYAKIQKTFNANDMEIIYSHWDELGVIIR
jgi:hypothetical protein